MRSDIKNDVFKFDFYNQRRNGIFIRKGRDPQVFEQGITQSYFLTQSKHLDLHVFWAFLCLRGIFNRKCLSNPHTIEYSGETRIEARAAWRAFRLAAQKVVVWGARQKAAARTSPMRECTCTSTYLQKCL